MTSCMVYGILNYDMFYIYIYFKIENKVIVNFMKWNIIVIEIVSSKEMTMYCTQRCNKSNLFLRIKYVLPNWHVLEHVLELVLMYFKKSMTFWNSIF